MGPEALRKAFDLTTGASSDFDLNPEVRLPPSRVLRDAAVLIAVTEGRVILTKRSSRLKHHPGQIAFPGGKIDAEDDGAIGAALREAEEEVGLPRGLLDVLGTLPAHETVTGYRVTPVLAHLRAGFAAVPERGEVDEVFSVPLSFVTNPANFRVERRRWLGEWRRYYAVPYGPYYIWGATARILRGLADRLAP
jgi:8-oxo-dGTP pyrophosphatase MutT (NUDIX family)